MFANPEELALRVISEYKEQNFPNLDKPKTVEEEVECLYSRWALDELSLCVLCSSFNSPPTERIRKFQKSLETYLKDYDLDDKVRIIFLTAYDVTSDVLELLECYQYEYFTVM